MKAVDNYTQKSTWAIPINNGAGNHNKTNNNSLAGGKLCERLAPTNIEGSVACSGCSMIRLRLPPRLFIALVL